MGCGSSSLKGDSSVGTDAPNKPSSNPLKKTTTQFDDVDYTTGRSRSPTKGSIAVDRAPDELDPTKQDVAMSAPEALDDRRPSHHVRDNRPVRDNSFSGRNDGVNLKPYHTIDGEDIPEEPMPAKSAHHRKNELEPDESEDTEEARRKSLFQRLRDGRDEAGKKRDSKTPMSDEDLQKYTGMSREEFNRQLAERGGKIIPGRTPEGYAARSYAA